MKVLAKILFVMSVFLAAGYNASAQHCEDGCNVNINGPHNVRVGDIVTYTVAPGNPNATYFPEWDNLHFLDGYAAIVDQGIDANGYEYITYHFIAAGSIWLTYQASYTCCNAQDFDEVTLNIAP